MYLYKYDITSFILTMSIFFQIVILLILLSKKWVFDEKRKKKTEILFPIPECILIIRFILKVQTLESRSFKRFGTII